MKSQREFPRLVISPKGTRWVEQGHPWIYEAEAVSGGENAENGVLVDAVHLHLQKPTYELSAPHGARGVYYLLRTIWIPNR